VFSGHTAGHRACVSERHVSCRVAETQTADEESCVHQTAKQTACRSAQKSHIINYSTFVRTQQILKLQNPNSSFTHPQFLVH